MREYAYLALVLFAIGCGGTEPDDNNPGGPTDAATGNSDAYVPPAGYTRLIGRTWTAPAGSKDIYKCVRVTIPQDMYITSIEAQGPLGTHHTVLSIASGQVAGPDGEQDCFVNTLGMVMLYASGVGTSPLNFPDGVGVKVAAGTQLHLNLHLYNASDEAITSESAIWVKSQPTPPPMLAEMIFAGPLTLTVRGDLPKDTVQKVTGNCPITKPYQLFALWPHMHKMAVHQQIELVRNGSATTLHDMPYDFEEQKYWLQSPEISLQQGDTIRVTCSYVNNTMKTVMWGDSSDEEMCFGGLYRYPAANSNLFCSI